MGSYLSQPIVAKESFDDRFEQLRYGVSGMQGWRMSMEDAHCCLPNFDGKKSCIFGVFDGHGGKEVAEYCATKFHEFLLDTDAFREGDIKRALREAYMNIDEAITSDEVIKELKVIGGVENNEEEDEAAMLLEEANMPIEDLLERLKNRAQKQLNSGGIEESLSDETDEDKIKNGLSSEKCVLTENGSAACENGTSSRSRKQKKPMKRSSEELETNVVVPAVEKNGEQGLSVTGVSMNILAAPGGSSSSSSETVGAGGSTGLPTIKIDDEDDDPEYEVGEDLESDEEEDDEDGEEGEVDDEEDDDSDESEEEEFEDSDGVEFQQGTDEVGKDSGTTAIIALIQSNKLYVANVGDSRCVLCRNGNAVDMSTDHKPEDANELKRIEKAGAKVTAEGRVNGGLNLSRAIGDHVYKQNKSVPPEEQAITADPEIKEIELNKEDSFMILACDGIWNVMTSEEAIQFVRERMEMETEEKLSLSKICEEMFDFCLAPDTKNDGSGCDNMTCMIIQFTHEGGVATASVGEKRLLSTSLDDNSPKSKKVKLNQE